MRSPVPAKAALHDSCGLSIRSDTVSTMARCSLGTAEFWGVNGRALGGDRSWSPWDNGTPLEPWAH